MGSTQSRVFPSLYLSQPHRLRVVGRHGCPLFLPASLSWDDGTYEITRNGNRQPPYRTAPRALKGRTYGANIAIIHDSPGKSKTFFTNKKIYYFCHAAVFRSLLLCCQAILFLPDRIAPPLLCCRFLRFGIRAFPLLRRVPLCAASVLRFCIRPPLCGLFPYYIDSALFRAPDKKNSEGSPRCLRMDLRWFAAIRWRCRRRPDTYRNRVLLSYSKLRGWELPRFGSPDSKRSDHSCLLRSVPRQSDPCGRP